MLSAPVSWRHSAASEIKMSDSGCLTSERMTSTEEGIMKFVVLGIGLEIVRQAIEHGHGVTAFVRTPDRLKTFGDRIGVIQGDLLSSAELEGVLGGHDAVL